MHNFQNFSQFSQKLVSLSFIQVLLEIKLELKRQADTIGKRSNVLISLYFIFNNSSDFHITWS